MRVLILLLLVVSFQESTFKVIGVLDGDTIEIIKNDIPVRVRLKGIDSPEKSQAFGTSAKSFTSELIYLKDVKIVGHEKDRYGRLIADVYLIDGQWLNKLLVENGLAWHYKKYSSDSQLAEAEQAARKAKLGLWRDTDPLEPWNFRRK